MNEARQNLKNEHSVESRRQTFARLHAELVKLPKAPVGDVQAPLILQVKYCWLVSLALPLLAGICYLGSIFGIETEFWDRWMRALLAIYGVCLLALVMMSMWTMTLAVRLRRIASGNYYVNWLVPEKDWQANCQQTLPNLMKFLLVGALIAVGSGLSFAGQAYADGNVYFATPARHFVLIGFISLAVGTSLGSFFWKLAMLKYKFASNHQGLVLIGPEGLYQTGSFWSFSGASQSLYDISFSTEKPQLLFKIGTSGEHGVKYEIVSIPIPDGELLKAKVLCRVLEETLHLDIMQPTQSEAK